MLDFVTNKELPSAQKLRGGYYTPPLLAIYLANWAIRTKADLVLEPSCGDGNLVVAALQRLKEIPSRARKGSGEIVGVEIDSEELASAKERVAALGVVKTNVKWHEGDFFDAFCRLKAFGPYDVVLGNPPFIRFQYFENSVRELAFDLLREFGYRPTKLANAWCAFVQLSIELLKDGGRLAMVLPAELLQVQYAAELRERLTTQFRHIVVVGFDQLVFPDIQQEVVLLLAEGRRSEWSNQSDIHTLQLRSGEDLKKLGNLDRAVSHLPIKHSRKGMKWTSLFLEEKSFDALDRLQLHPELQPLKEYASVDVGVVTGRNSFFVIHVDKAEQLRMNGYVMPVVGRTSALRSIIFSENDLLEFEKQHPARLINLRGVDGTKFSKQLNDYIRAAEMIGVHQGYKCRIRSRWYDVPSIYAPEAFLYRQIHDAPFLVANVAGATATDTIHRVRTKPGIDTITLCAASINSLTFAWAEVCGRSYGGGVLELEPREAEELPIPLVAAKRLDVEKLDALLRKGKLVQALDYADHELLVDGLGMTKKDVGLAREAWLSLRERRRGRRQTS